MTVYRPHSAKTTVPYGELLALLKRHVTLGMDDSVHEVATEVLEVVRRTGVSDGERKTALDNLFGTAARLSDETARQIISIAAQLDDFVPAGKTAAKKRRDAAGGSDDDEEDEEDDLDMSEAEDDEAMQQALAGMEIAGDDADDDDDDNGPLSFEDIDAAYLTTNVSKLMPYLSAADAQQRSAKALEAMADESNPDAVVATQLLMTFDGWSEPAVQSWVNRLVASRWAVVYATRRATGGLSMEQVVSRVREHAARDPSVLALLASLVGGSAATQRKSAADAMQGDDDGAAGARVRQPADMELVDLKQFAFEEGSKLNVRKGKLVVPQGTERFSHETHEEIVVPPQKLYAGTEALVGLHEFAPWALPAFPAAVKSLNPMQSRVFPAAYHTDSNLLICAPTGAGKTNVAMTAILRELAKWRDAESDSFFYEYFKMIYVAPMKALVQEVVRTFGERLAPLGVVVAELSGDQGLSQVELNDAQLIVTTPEKWDVVTRKGMDRGAAALVKLIIIDEIHLLHSDRGPVLEAIVSRSRQHAENGGGDIRLVGLSATLPNYEDVAAFLGITDKSKGLFHFDASFRPVPLKQTFAGVKKTKRVAGRASTMNQVAYGYARDFVRRAEGVLMFVHGRKDAITTADLIHRMAADDRNDTYFSRPRTAWASRLQEAAAEVRHPRLRELLPFGVAFHHAGVCREDRAIVESLFFDRVLLCLVCTATLAWGVNLPAHGVIIKGTKVVNAARGGFDDLSPLDVFQMFGRAGRPGFDTFGEAVIITSMDDIEYYVSLLNQQLPIESRLMNRLVDCINAEVVLGSIRSVDDAVKWLEWTYLFVRMLRSPKLYGISADLVRRDPSLREHRENIAHTVLTLLDTRQLAKYDKRFGEVRSTELGRIASHYYLTGKSVETYSKLLKHDIDDVDIFRAFSLSSEFDKIATRDDELAELRRLIQLCPIPVRDPIDKACTKINILLQAYISNQRLEGLALSSELAYVKDSATRIARALLDIALVRGHASTARRLIRFYNEVQRQLWSAYSPLRQFNVDALGGVIRRIEGTRLDWETLHLFVVEEGQFDNFAPQDLTLQELTYAYIHRVPRMHFEHTALLPITRSTCKAEIALVVDFEYVPDIHGPVLEAYVTIEDSDGVRLHHCEHVYLNKEQLLSQQPLVVTALLPVADPKPAHYFVRVNFLGWLGSETSTALSLIGLTLPAPAVAPIVPNTRTGIELESLNDPWLDAFFVAQLSEFTTAQSHMLPELYRNPGHAFVSMPLGSGRTVATELFLARALKSAPAKTVSTIVYLHPGQATLKRREAAWTEKLRELKNFVVEAPEASIIVLPPPYCGTPDDAALLVKDAQRRMAASEAGGGVVIVLSTPFVWRGVMSRRKEFADVFASIHDVIADGVQWLGEAHAPISGSNANDIAPPTVFGSRASFGAAYEAVLIRVLEQARERSKSAPGAPPISLLLLCTPSFQAQEMCDWAKVSEPRRFNFSLSSFQTTVTVEPSEHGGRSAESSPGEQRVLRLLAQPKYEIARVAVVVPSRIHVVSLARLIADTLRDKPLAPYPLVEDKTLAALLSVGVAYVDEATSASDLAIIRDRLKNPAGAPKGLAPRPRYLPPEFDQELVVVMSPAAVEHFAAREFHLGIVAGTAVHAELPRGYLCLPSSDSVDVSRNVMQLLVSRAEATTILCSAASAQYWERTVAQALPILPCIDAGRYPVRVPAMTPSEGVLTDAEKTEAPFRVIAWQYADEVLTRVVEAAIANMDQLVRFLSGSFLGRCIRSNPTVYGLPDDDVPEARGEFFSGVAEVLIKCLTELHCVTFNEETLAVKPTLLGVTVARYRVPSTSLAAVVNMRVQGDVNDLIAALCSAPFVRSLCPYLPKIDRFPQLTSRGVKSTASKAAALVKTWMSRESVHKALEGDMKRVVPAVAALAAAAVEVLAKLHWPLSRSTMGLIQLLVQRSDDAHSVLMQIPHFDAAAVELAATVAPSLLVPEDLPDLDDAVRTALFARFSEAQVEDIATWCNSVPLVDVSAARAVGPQGESLLTVRLNTSLADDDVDPTAAALPNVLTPHWTAPSRRCKWWVAVVGGASVETLRALRFVAPTKLSEAITMRIDGADAEALHVLAISDTYRTVIRTTLDASVAS